MSTAVVDSLLRLGDNGLILSHRLSEAVGKQPILEEELASANVALDLLGQARLWLALAGEIEGEGRDADALAFFRDVRAFRNVLLVEQPNGDFAFDVARQFFFDAWHHLVLRGLSRVTDHRVRDIATKASKEVAYHVRRSGDWVVRLGDGTEESHRRMQAAVNDLWPFVDELFTDDETDAAAHAAGMGVLHAPLRASWDTLVHDTLAAATLTVPPASKWPQRGGKQGRHGEQLGYVLADLQYMQRAYPGQSW